MSHTSTFTILCSLFATVFISYTPLVAMQNNQDVILTHVNEIHEMLSVCIPTLCTHITDPRINELRNSIKNCNYNVILTKNMINNLEERANSNDYDCSTMHRIMQEQAKLGTLLQQKATLDAEYAQMNSVCVQDSQNAYIKSLRDAQPRKHTITISISDLPAHDKAYRAIPANNQKIQAAARSIRAKEAHKQDCAIDTLAALKTSHRSLSPHNMRTSLQHPARGIQK